MADQVRRAIARTYRNAKSFGGDAQRLYVSGRSSGSHLGACAAITDWTAFGLPADAVKGYVLQSGRYDLRGPRPSRRSSCVKFTDEWSMNCRRSAASADEARARLTRPFDPYRADRRRRANTPNAPAPVANSSSAPGSGITAALPYASISPSE